MLTPQYLPRLNTCTALYVYLFSCMNIICNEVYLALSCSHSLHLDCIVSITQDNILNGSASSATGKD